MSFSQDEIKALRNILEINLNVKKDERIFVLVNDPETLPERVREKGEDLLQMGRKLLDEGKYLCDVDLIIFPAAKMHGEEPHLKVWEELLPNFTGEVEEDLFEKILSKSTNSDEEELLRKIAEESGDRIDGVVALTFFSTSHTFFRRLLTSIKKTRYASMPLFERYMLLGAMNVDYREIESLSLRVKERLVGAEKVFIEAPNGTAISLSVEGREFIADTGLLVSPGAFGNLPAGEVFVAPVEETAEGKLVIEYGPEEGKLDSQIVVFIEKGNAVEIKGEGRVRELLETKFAEDDRCRNVAELGIGTNSGATHVENILEAEKILGTIHIAFGDNSSFGGKVSAPFHQDFVVFSPTVKIQRKEELFVLHKEGQLIV